MGVGADAYNRTMTSPDQPAATPPPTPPPTVEDLERDLRALAASLVDPEDHECLLCFLRRVVADLGCDTTLRWARRYRDLRVPRATGLERRLGDVGGFCDCEVLVNGWWPAREVCERDLDTDELHPPDPWPGCAGVRGGSARPCVLWVRRTRWDDHGGW